MSLENLPATKRLYWWRTHRPLTVRFWRIPGEELTPNLHPGPPGSTRSPRPARWPPWPCFQNVGTPPSYAYLQLDAGTHLGTSCPPWTLTITACLSSLRPLPLPPCLVGAELTQIWACGDSVVLIQHYGFATAFPLLGRSTAVWGHKNRPLSEMNTHNAESFVVWRFCQRHFEFWYFGSPISSGWFSFVQGFIADPSYSLSLSFLLPCSPWHLRLMQRQQLLLNAVAMAPGSCLQPTTHLAPHIISSSFLICGSLI